MRQELDRQKAKSAEPISVVGRGVVLGFLAFLAITIALVVIMRYLL